MLKPIVVALAALAALTIAQDAAARTQTVSPPPAAGQSDTQSTAKSGDVSAYPHTTVEYLRKTYGKANARITRIGGVDVYYVDEGAGPAILMVHGSNSTLRTWDGVAAKMLKHHYRVIRYDIPPQGLSGPVSDEAAAKLKPTDIPLALLDQLGVTKVTVFGVSSGGTMGMFLAAARPDMVERLILSNTPSDPVTTGHLKESEGFLAAQAEATKTGFQSLNFWNLFLAYFSGDPRRYSPALRTEYYDINRKTPQPHKIALVAVVADHAKAVAAMSAVKAPTLLLWGGADPLLIPKAADILEGYLTSTRVSRVFLNDVGHYPPMEVPDRWSDIALAYMQAAAPLPVADPH